MSHDPHLDNLKHKIERAKKENQPEDARTFMAQGSSLKRLGKFVSVGVELVAGVLAGVGCGLVIDRVLGTSPWGLISLFILGSAAGILNVYRVLTTQEKDNTKKPPHA
jgi:ATP synthase protein I